MESREVLLYRSLPTLGSLPCTPLLSISSDDHDTQIIDKIHEQFSRRTSVYVKAYNTILRAVSMQNFVIGTATHIKVTPVLPPPICLNQQALQTLDSESQQPGALYLNRIYKDEFLTSTFHHPFLLSPNSKLIATYMFSELLDRKDNSVDEQIFCVYLGLDEMMVGYWQLVALTLSVFGGLAAGFSLKDGQVGLDVATAILALLLVIQGALKLWANRDRGCGCHREQVPWKGIAICTGAENMCSIPPTTPNPDNISP